MLLTCTQACVYVSVSVCVCVCVHASVCKKGRALSPLFPKFEVFVSALTEGEDGLQ